MNPHIKIVKTELLSDNWYTLNKVTVEHTMRGGATETYSREAYDRGNGATILLFNRATKNVVLTRQFRLPTYLNGNPTGMLIEACAGLLDKDSAHACIRREVEEETGYAIKDVTKIMEVYMSPGSVTELLYFFTGEYSRDSKVSDGGGVDNEDIEVIEMPFAEALAMIDHGEIKDAKTIILLQYAKLKGLM
jgi:GDP-mannose pyrophosphatase NudK